MTTDTPQAAAAPPECLAVAEGLVYLAARAGRVCEPRAAARLVVDVSRCWPGRVEEQWWKWLLEAGRSLQLELRVADVGPRDLGALVKANVAVVAGPVTGESLTVYERSGRRGVRQRRLDGRPLTRPEGAVQEVQRVVLATPQPLHSDHHGHARPLTLLWRLIDPERKDILAVCGLSAVAGLLLISVPVTAQQLVRAVTFASLYQPIVVLSLLLLGLLGFVAALQTIQYYVAEVIQRRLFVRTAMKLSHRLPHAAAEVWQSDYPPELVNRFLDIVIVQKKVSALLVDGVSIVLTTFIGMVVMAFYHPYLLGYDVILLGALAAILFGFGRSGVTTAIQESKCKYSVQAWLEDIARCPSVFRSGGVELLATQRADALCAAYLSARSRHFRVLLRQIILILGLQAVAMTALLGLGGYLVLQEQLTLGQLVAAELIVATIVASVAKLSKHLEGWYDLLAAVDKLAHVTDLPQESSIGLVGLPRRGPAGVQFHSDAWRGGSSDARPESARIDIPPGECVVLEAWTELETAQLTAALQGDGPAAGWRVMLDGVDTIDLRPDVVRSHVAVVREQEFLPGSIEENVHLHRPEVAAEDVLRILEALGLAEALRERGVSLTAALTPKGWPLTPSERRRLMLARGLVARPRVLFVDHLLDGLPDAEVPSVATALQTVAGSMTVLVATGRELVDRQFSRRVARPADAPATSGTEGVIRHGV